MASKVDNKCLLSFNNITMVVKDIEKTSQLLSVLLGIGPWESMEYKPSNEDLIVGNPFKLKFAFARLGTTTLQLTQPIEGKSPWKAFLDKKGEGLHNLYFEVTDWDGTIDKFKKEGNTVLASGRLDGKRWCLFEAKQNSFRIEIGER